MKKKILVTSVAVMVLVFAMVVDSHAQFKFGIKAGYNSATIGGLDNVSNVKELKALGGLHGGVFAQVKIAIISLQLDALYSQQGAKWTDDNNGSHDMKNDYINFPAVAKVNLGPINVMAGLQYGILLSSKIDGDTDPIGIITKSDLSVPVGVGIDIKKLMLEARYNIGISNINNIPGSTDTFTNGVLQLSAGIKF